QESIPCPIPAGRFGLSATRLGDKVYVFGGCCASNQAACNDMYEYSIPDKTWRQIATKQWGWPGPRSCHSAVVLDGRLVIAGGVEWKPLTDAWAFDPAGGRWCKLPDAPARFYGSASSVVSDTLHIWGNRTNNFRSMHLSYTKEGGWVQEKDLAFSASYPACAQTQGNTLLVGGARNDTSVHCYETVKDKFRFEGEVSLEFKCGRMAILTENRV
ncbi:hypothetical protein KIPB_011078, partial [Kipferlia bialata]